MTGDKFVLQDVGCSDFDDKCSTTEDCCGTMACNAELVCQTCIKERMPCDIAPEICCAGLVCKNVGPQASLGKSCQNGALSQYHTNFSLVQLVAFAVVILATKLL